MPWTKDDAEILRQMVRHESEVINDRLSYLMTLQGLLFASLGFAWESNAENLIILLSVVGVLTSISILYMLYLAQRAIANLIKKWNLNKPQEYDGPDIVGIWPKRPIERLLSPSFILPMLFTIAWIVVPFIR